MSTDDLSDFIHDLSDFILSLPHSVPSEAVSDFETFERRLRPTAVGRTKYRQDRTEIDRALLDEHKARATARSKPAHAEPGTRPGRKRKAAGRSSQAKAPPGGLDLVQAFSIAGAKARKRREKLDRFGPAEARGMHRRRARNRVPTS